MLAAKLQCFLNFSVKKMKTASAVYTQNIGVVGVVSKSLAGKPDKKVI